MEPRRLLLFALLSMVILFGWQALFPPPESPQRELPIESSPPPSASDPSPVAPSAVDEPEEPGEPEELQEPVVRQAITASIEEISVLENAAVRAEFTNRGGQLVSVLLKEHPNGSGGPVDLVRRREGFPYPLGWTDQEGGSTALNDALFQPEQSGRGVLEYRYSGELGAASKRYELHTDGLLSITVETEGAEPWGLNWGPGIRNPTEAETENRFARRSAVFSIGGEIERLDPIKTQSVQSISGRALAWLGLQDTYFLAAVLPSDGLDEVLVRPFLVASVAEAPNRFEPLPAELSAEQEDLARELQLVLIPQGERLQGDAYLGPKQYDRLASLPGGLQQTVDLGIFSFLGRPLLWCLNWIHDNVVSNYGWAIIMLTFLIRLLLFPLNHKSIVSMQKMQTLNPKMQSIRQKYRSKLKDKQGRPNREAQAKMNQEIMALYKQEGVNPAAGCLPLLMQMPVLFAFYALLSSAIELRHSPWLGWIHDLSAPDPFWILPFIMGGTMFIQQKMSPPGQDPMQRRIFMMMPVMFTFLFLGFPSGLVLYWLTNNVLAIAQQAGYKKYRATQAAGQPSDEPAKKSKRNS